MQLSRLTLIEVASQLISVTVTVTLAIATRSIWALVIGALTSSIASTILGYFMLPGKGNRLAWDKSSVDELIAFGKWVFLSSIIGFMVINGDRILLGGLVDAQTLGLYTVAFMLANSVQAVMSMISGNIVFPALSEVVRDRPNDLRQVANKFQRLGDRFLMTSCGFLIMAGNAIVTLLYDKRYHGAGMMLSFLALSTVGMRYQVLEQCYVAMGKPKIIAATNMLRLLSLAIGIPLGFHYYQLTGAMFAIVLSQFASWPTAVYFKLKFKLMEWSVEANALPPLLIGLALGFLFDAVSPSRQALRAIFFHQ